MFNYTCLNPIAGVGLDLLSDEYNKVDDIKDAQAVLVRSAAMHDMELPKTLEVVARAGAGVNKPPQITPYLVTSTGSDKKQEDTSATSVCPLVFGSSLNLVP